MFRHYLRAASLGACLALGVAPAIAEQATWEMAMNDADVRDVVREVGAILDQTIILDPRVQGRITVLSSEQLDREGIRRLFYSVLNAQGFAAVNDGDRLLVLPANEAKAWANQQYEAIPAAFTTQVFNLSGSVATDLAGLLRPLVSSNGYIGPSSSANALVITDSAANLERMRTLIAQLDSGQRHDHELVTLRHAQVSDLLPVLEAAAGSSDGGVRVLADERGNRVLVLGPIKSRQRLAQLARSMDVPAPVNAQNWRVVRLQHSNAEQLAEVLSEVGKRMERKPTQDGLDSAALGQAVIKADTSQNALVLLGSPPTLGSVVQIIEQLDQPRAQVLIHAAIVEVSGDISEALGLQWGVNTGSLKGGITVPESGVTLPDLLGSELALPGGAALAAGSDRFAVLVSALASNSRSNLLSTPSLLTLDNQEAQILVGQNVPFKTGSYTTPGSGSDNPFNTVERQDVGISLKVRPYINEGRSLRLEVEQESSEVVPSALEDDLVTNKRSLKSTILTQDGEIIVIGGLIKDSVKSEQRGVPGLSRLPWVGGLFRWKRDVQEKTNLMVFLRPTVLRNPQQLIDTGERAWQDLRTAPAARLPQESRQLFEGQQP